MCQYLVQTQKALLTKKTLNFNVFLDDSADLFEFDQVELLPGVKKIYNMLSHSWA
jgi:hypothetical protein